MFQFKDYEFDIKDMNTYYQEPDLNHIKYINTTMKDIESKIKIMENNLKVKTMDLMQLKMIMKNIHVTNNHILRIRKKVYEGK